MKTKINSGFVVAIVFLAAAIFAGGCTTIKTGSTQKANQEDWEWVPSVWVEDRSFSGSQFSRCSYDQATNYYLCPPGTL